MSAPGFRLVLGSLLALSLTPPGHADEAAVRDQLKKIGVYVITVNGESAVAFDFTKGVAEYLKLLPEIKTLAFIRLSKTDVTDAGLKELARCKALRQLHVTDAHNITDAGVRELRGLENLEDLGLDRSQVTGVSFAELKALKKLKNLSLRGSPVTDDGLKAMAEVSSIQYLELPSTKITDAGLPALKSLKKLERLYIYSTGITDQGLKVFQSASDFARLKSLDVSKTQVTKDGVAELKAARGRKKSLDVTTAWR